MIVVVFGVIGFEVWCELFVLDDDMVFGVLVVFGVLISGYGLWLVYLILDLLYMDIGVFDIDVLCDVFV